MNSEKIFEAGMGGTTLMTLFSYGASTYTGKDFREPALLAKFFQKQLKNSSLAVPAGWLTHYTMGICWAAVFRLLFANKIAKPDVRNAVLLGTGSGITAIAIWHLAFKLCAANTKISFKSFYTHLVLAHLVYSLSVTALIKKN